MNEQMAHAAGTRLGPYEILSPIGAGGMGEVYKARDTRLGRIVAIASSRIRREVYLARPMSGETIVIHRSAFFHSINLELQFGSVLSAIPNELRLPSGEQVSPQYLYQRMYSLAENKLAAFLGYVGVANRRTRFLVYSRGAPGGWAEDGYRQAWVTNLERRFPALKGRVFTMSVEGGVEKASFRDPQTVASVKGHVRSILGLGSSPAQTGK